MTADARPWLRGELEERIKQGAPVAAKILWPDWRARSADQDRADYEAARYIGFDPDVTSGPGWRERLVADHVRKIVRLSARSNAKESGDDRRAEKKVLRKIVAKMGDFREQVAGFRGAGQIVRGFDVSVTLMEARIARIKARAAGIKPRRPGPRKDAAREEAVATALDLLLCTSIPAVITQVDVGSTVVKSPLLGLSEILFEIATGKRATSSIKKAALDVFRRAQINKKSRQKKKPRRR